jgi:hypothetical protein
MKFDVLEKLIRTKTSYFIAVHKTIDSRDRESQSTYLICCPSKLWRLKPEGKLSDNNEYLIDDKDISLELLKKVDSMYVEANIPLSDNFTPFQSGIQISWFDEVYEIDEYINEFLLEVFLLRKEDKLKKYRFWDYINLYKTICENNSKQQENL